MKPKESNILEVGNNKIIKQAKIAIVDLVKHIIKPLNR